MWSRILNSLTGGKKKLGSNAEQRAILKGGDAAALRKLAEHAGTDPEILYYLARTGNPDVRRAVAGNRATPLHASTLLAQDKDVDVRYALAARLVELLPELSPEEHSQLYAYTVQALGVLAKDEVSRIRLALSSALKDYAKAPPEVVARLARDLERAISEPILRFCVALSDDDMFDILSNHPEPWVISAIAGRPVIGDALSDRIIASGDREGTGTLLRNLNASLSAAGLEHIIAQAREYPEWHEPVALRPELTLDLANQLAGFVSDTVMGVLERRSDYSAEQRKHIADIVARRVTYRAGGKDETGEVKAERYFREGRMNAATLNDAVAWQDMPFFYAGIARMAGIHPQIAKTMMTGGAARPIIALCWKAGLPMRMCVDLQRLVGKLQPKDLVYAKGGTDYPLTPEEIKWQLEFFGIA